MIQLCYGFKSLLGSQLVVLFCFQQFVRLGISGIVAASSFHSLPTVGMHNIEARRDDETTCQKDAKITQFMSVADVHDIDLANELVIAVFVLFYFDPRSSCCLLQLRTCGWDVAQALNVFFSGPSLADSSLTRQANDQHVDDRAINTTSPISDTLASHFNNTQEFVNDAIDDSETDEGLKAAIRESLNDDIGSLAGNQVDRAEPMRREEASAPKLEPKTFLRGNEPNPISRLRSAPTHDTRRIDSTKHRRMSLENLESRSSRLEEEKILADRFLRYDQDEEYELSLAQDRARLQNPCDAPDLFKLNLSS